MGLPQERAFEVVVLAASFRDERGRAWIADNFPASVVALYDAVTARGDWADAADLAAKGLVVARVLEEDADLAARYQADVDAGHLGFGAGEDEEMDAAIDSVTRSLTPPSPVRLPPLSGPLTLPRAPLKLPFPLDSIVTPIARVDPETGAHRLPSGPLSPAFSLPDTDIFLSADEPPAAAEPPAATEPAASEPPAPEDVDTIRSWLNATLDRPSTELAVGAEAVLSVFLGERDQRSTASVETIVVVAKGRKSITLDVAVASTDFEVTRPMQTLVLRRDGTTKRPAEFAIVPKSSGPARLTIVVTVGGNFVQRIDITYDVGGSAEDSVRERGRPVAAAEMLQPRSASIQITKEGGVYEVFAPAAFPESTPPRAIPLRATLEDLAPRVEDVRAALLAAVNRDAFSLELKVPQAETDALLSKLAFAGFRLFQAVFEDNASAELRMIGDWLRREAGKDDVTTVQVVSDAFPVPWPLMYLADRFDRAALTWDAFLGMQCVVEQIPFAPLLTPPSPTIDSQPQLAVHALLNESIDEDMPSHPVAAQREYWGGRGVNFTEGTTRADLETALVSDVALQVLYFFCHAKGDDDDADYSELIMTKDDIITLGEIKAVALERTPFAGSPLVFLNACESGELSLRFYSGFVPYFLNRGARGVIGTECRVPGLFASEWAKAFFDRLFDGEPLGKVVLDLRRSFREKHNNPLGLLYVVHCDTDTVVSPALT